MYKSVFIWVAILILTSPAAFSVNLFNGPESAAFDTLQNRYLISNAYSGTIVEIDSNGNTSYYQTGFGMCLGNCISDDVFYFTTGNTRTLHGFDLNADTAVVSLTIPTAVNLDGITSDNSGNLYIVNDATFETNIIKVNTFDYSYEIIASGLTSNGQDIVFDEINNRLIVCFFGLGNPITAIYLSDYSVEDLTIFPYGRSDGITIDAEANVYVAASVSGCIYKYDSTFSNAPEELSCSIGWVAGPDYNKYDEILVCPQFYQNSVTFIEMKYKASCDTTYGAVPMDINFTGQSDYDIASWHWDFGDGNSSGSQSPLHTYTDPGFYTATMQIITTADDTLYRKLHNIIIHADTIKADTIYGEADQSEELIIYGNNTVSIDEIVIPVEYNGTLPLTYDSFSTAGCRTDYFETVSYLNIDSYNKRFTLKLRASPSGTYPPLPSGDGALLKLYFSYHPASNPSHNTTIYLDGYNTYLPTYTGQGITYTTEITNGYMTVLIPPCCVGIRGNIDNDPLDQIDISDLVFFVSYSFNSGAEPPCMDEADVDGSGGEAPIDISDIVALVGFMFQGGANPADCP